jgi:predicted transcriptional regulator
MWRTTKLKSVFANRKKRSREEIIASIMFTARQGLTKTGIMYANYLSSSQVNKYLAFALEAKILYVNGDGKYLTTSKGTEYLKWFEQVHNVENDALEKRKMLIEILDSDYE